MAVDARKYLQELAQSTGVDVTSLEGVMKVLEGNDKFATALAASVSRQEDYSRNMDALRKDREAFQADKSSWTDWYKSATETDAAREAELQDLRKKVGTNGGGGAGGGNSDKVGMTREDLDKVLASERGNMISVIKAMGTISSRHAAEFHEALDVGAVEKIALEKRITVEQAYEDYVAPRIQTRKDEEFAAKLKAAHDDGVKEGLSKVGLPDDSAAPRGHHVLFDRPRATDGKPAAAVGLRERAASFADAWNSGATKQ
jgi:hypothetical protein